jgi:hypothetical protein
MCTCWVLYLLGHKLLHVVLGEPVVAPFGPGHEGHRDLPDLRLHLFPATMTGRDTLRDLAHFPNATTETLLLLPSTVSVVVARTN